ncbi:MAG: hypothetical protein AAFX06_34150, partial [Planctomycetota bacterium]
ALNGVELILASLITIATFGFPRTEPRRIRTTIVWTLVLLAFQTVLLYTKLDQRTALIINGEDVPPAPYHLIYIAMESVKLFLLVGLSHFQIRHFQQLCATPQNELPGGKSRESDIYT